MGVRGGTCLFLVCALLFVLRRHFAPLATILNVYVNWPIHPPPHLHIAAPVLSGIQPITHDPPPQTIPRILHHILLGTLSENPPQDWTSARESCLSLHPTWDKHYWTEAAANDLISQHYPHLLDTFNSYTSIIQRADSLRYFVMYHYGGVFLDMDLECTASLEPLVFILEAEMASNATFFHYRDNNYTLAIPCKDMLLATKARPVGVSNGFIIATKHHPVMLDALQSLPKFNRNFIFSYATVMFSTGCMFLSAMLLRNNKLWNTVRVLGGRENMLNGRVYTPLFKHLGSSSWHAQDAKAMIWMAWVVRKRGQYIIFGIILGIFIGWWIWRRRHAVRIGKSSEKYLV